MNTYCATTSHLDYKKTSLILSQNLRKLQEISQLFQFEASTTSLNTILEKMEKNCFSIGVVGEFNRGKSTFINAILGQEILPSDILATTATISRITARNIASAQICFKDNQKQEIFLEELGNYMTKLSAQSTAIANKIKETIIYYPWAFSTHQKVEFIDTPGLNDDEPMTQQTLAILQQCDIAVMMISVQSPFALSEASFLKKLLSHGIHKIVFIVNQIDLLKSSQEAEKIIHLIQKRIDDCIQEWLNEQPNNLFLPTIQQPIVLGISALKALKARTNNDSDLLEESRFSDCEKILRQMVDQEWGLIRLQAAFYHLSSEGQKIISYLEHKMNDFDLKQEHLMQTKRPVDEKLNQLIAQKIEFSQEINSTFNLIKQQAHVYPNQLMTNLQEKIGKMMNSTVIHPDFQEKTATEIISEFQQSHQQFSEKLNNDIQTILAHVESRINHLMILLKQIEQSLTDDKNFNPDNSLSFAQIVSAFQAKYQSFIHLNLASFSLSFSCDSNQLILTEKANGKGTWIGAGIGTVLLGPVGGGIGAAIGSAIGENRRVNRFREQYQSNIMPKIDQVINEMKVYDQVNHYLDQAFQPLTEIQVYFERELTDELTAFQLQLSEHLEKETTLILAQQQQVSYTHQEILTILSQIKNISLL